MKLFGCLFFALIVDRSVTVSTQHAFDPSNIILQDSLGNNRQNDRQFGFNRLRFSCHSSGSTHARSVSGIKDQCHGHLVCTCGAVGQEISYFHTDG